MLIYDGDCGFCTRSAHWLQGRLRTPITVIPWQEIDDLDELGLTVDDVTTAAYWIDAYGRASRGSAAVAQALVLCTAPLPVLGWLAQVPPLSWAAAGAYRLVARFRHRLPGATVACAEPSRVSFTPPSQAGA